MEEKKKSEFLKRLSEIIDELHEFTNNDSKRSFIILARDAEFDNSLHLISASGARGELAKNVFGLLAVNQEKEFVRDALRIYSEYLENSSKTILSECLGFLPDNTHLN